MREWLRRDLRRHAPIMVQAHESESDGTADGESDGADDVFSEYERTQSERNKEA
jgi:hypothetical protein